MDPVPSVVLDAEYLKMCRLLREAFEGWFNPEKLALGKPENIIGQTFLFVPEHEKGGTDVHCFTIASIRTQRHSDIYLRLVIANQPGNALAPRLLAFDPANGGSWILFHEHQLINGGDGNRGYLRPLVGA